MNIIKKFYGMSRIFPTMRLCFSGYLLEKGWLNSYSKFIPIDKNNDPIPWCNYSFLNFFEYRLNKNQRVFEYGCGNSTLWYSKKVNEVVSVEHDKNWANKLKEMVPNNVTIIYKDIDDGYSNECKNHGLFDIIIIDGRERLECCIQTMKSLKENGVIIFDDTHRSKYNFAFQIFKENGFNEITIEGMKPNSCSVSKTTIFYRDYNCLNI